MKEIDPKDPPDASGGFSPDDGGCIPFPVPEYPPWPDKPFPQPMPNPVDPALSGPVS